MRAPFATLATLAALATLAGCPGDEGDTDPDSDTDSDTFDPGTDVDTDTDSDTDTDTDTDSDTTPPTNLLTNAGFESATAFEGWAIFPDTLTNRSITTTARTGSSAARLFARASGTGGETPVYQQVAGTPGTCYTLRGWLYHPSTEPLVGTEAWLALKFFTADFGGFSSQESARVSASTTADTWTRFEVLGAVPPNFAWVQAALELWECQGGSGTCTSSGAAYFDDIEFFESPGACSSR